jgi:hypothetical protein
MQAISNAHHDIVAKLVPGGVPSLAHLSDQELLTSTRRLVGKSNHLFAALLLHLAEVEARGFHRTRLCASLYTYCIYELRFSEDAAARRSSAARLVKQFPLLFDAIANGELHLTGLLMIGPHLTPENHVEVIGRAKFRTKKELAKLVRELNPLPQVPDLVQPLRPVPALPTTRPSWAKLVASLEPRVRELPAGERPRDWANDAEDDGASQTSPSTSSGAAPARYAPPTADTLAADTLAADTLAADTLAAEPSLSPDERSATEPDLLPQAPSDLPPITGPQQYQMQFTTTEEHVQLVERAKALLARTEPGVTLAELHIAAMRLLVASLEKRKFAVTDGPRKPAHSNGCEPRLDADGLAERANAAESDPPMKKARTTPPSAMPQATTPPSATTRPATTRPAHEPRTAPRQPGRYVPAAERREVYTRDDGRCTFTDAGGQRCRETRYLELHHLKPFSHGGENIASNLTLRCAAHNALAAEQDFGRERVARQRDSTRHESRAARARTTLPEI